MNNNYHINVPRPVIPECFTIIHGSPTASFGKGSIQNQTGSRRSSGRRLDSGFPARNASKLACEAGGRRNDNLLIPCKYIVTFSIVLLVLMVSCSKKTSSVNPDTQRTQEAATTLSADTTDTDAVNFITWNEDYFDSFKKLVPEFEKETGIKVNWKLLSEDIVRDKVLVDLASRSGEFDLVLTDVWIMPEQVANGYLEPLNKFITGDPSFDLNLWYPKFIEGLTFDGTTYALPTESFGASLVYRKDLFEKYKVKVPTTLDELDAAAKRLTLDIDGDGKVDVYGVASRGKAGEEPSIIVSGYAWAYGGSWFEGKAATAEDIKRLKARPAFNSPQFLEGFKKYCNLLKKYGPPGIKDYTWYEIVEDGKKGTVAMLIYAGFNIGAVDKDSVGMRDKYYNALPARGPQNFVQEAFVMGYGINSASKHKDAAWKFLKFITSEKFMSNVVEDYATSIAIKGLREGKLYRELHPYKSPNNKYVLEEDVNLIDWRYMPHIPEYSVIANMLGTATSECIAGKKNALVALDELNEAVYKLMKQAGYYNDGKR